MRFPSFFLFFFYSENSASNALGFLKNVKTAADRIAFAVEQAERTNVDHDTMTVYLYGDDYRDIQNYLASTKPKGALVKGPLPGVKLNAITMQSIGPAPTINETPMGLCMIFTNESGNMLPQKVLVRLRNGPLNSTKPMNVRLERGNSMRPVVPFVPVGNLQTAAGSPLGGPQIDKSKNTLSPAENTPTKNDFPKVAGAAAQNSVLPSPAPVPQIDIKSLFSGIPGFSSLNGSQTRRRRVLPAVSALHRPTAVAALRILLQVCKAPYNKAPPAQIQANCLPSRTSLPTCIHSSFRRFQNNNPKAFFDFSSSLRGRRGRGKIRRLKYSQIQI